MDFLGLSLQKFQIKWSFAPQPWKNCYTAWNFQDQKARLSSTPLVMLIFFFFFFFDLWSFCSIIFQYTPKKFQVFNPPPPPVWNFFRSSSSCHASIIVIWLFGWNSPVRYWTIPEKLQTGGGRERGWVGILFWNVPSGDFRFVTLPLEILEKTSFFTPGNSVKLCAAILKLEIPRSKTKTQGNFTSVFL